MMEYKQPTEPSRLLRHHLSPRTDGFVSVTTRPRAQVLSSAQSQHPPSLTLPGAVRELATTNCKAIGDLRISESTMRGGWTTVLHSGVC